MKKHKILYLITRSERGGAQSHLVELLAGLNSRYDLVLATGENGYLMDYACKHGIECILVDDLIRPLSLRHDLRAYGNLVRLIRQIKPDLVHAHSSKAGILGRIAAWRCGVPRIFTAHGWAFARGTPLMRKVIAILPEMFLARVTDRIITVSEADRQLAMHYRIAKPEQLVTIHNGIRNSTATHDYSIEENIPRLVMVARFAPPKNYRLLLKAASYIEENFVLTLVGDGPEFESVKKYCGELDLLGKVKFPGSRDDVAEVLATSDVFLLISDWEGFPISIIEAMRAGLPIIASDVGGIHEAVKNEHNGLLIRRNDTTGLSTAMQRMITDRACRQQFGERSRALYLRYYSTDTMLSRTQQLYSSLGYLPDYS